MAKVNYTGIKSEKHIKPSYIIATLFNGAEGETELDPKGDTFILEDVVEDTTSCSQDDNETTTIECETSDSPIIEIVKAGKFQFAAEVADTQEDLLIQLGGFVKDETNKRVLAPSAYRNRYCKVAVVFENGVDATGKKKKYVAFIVPKLQLNSKILFESLNSNIARISLAGTANNVHIEVNGAQEATSFYKQYDYEIPTEE